MIGHTFANPYALVLNICFFVVKMFLYSQGNICIKERIYND